MKELQRFRQFLNENELSPYGEPLADIDPNQTIFAVNFKEKGDDGEVSLYVAVDTEREARKLARQYMVDGYEAPFKLVDSRNLGTFDDLDEYGEKDADLWKGNIADFGYA